MFITAFEALEIVAEYRFILKKFNEQTAMSQLGILKGSELYQIVENYLVYAQYSRMSHSELQSIKVSIT
jgi:hypothetical protein